MNMREFYPGPHQGARWYPEDIVGMGGGTKGKYWFVDGDKGAGQGGRTWEDAFSTITEANDAMGDEDVCFIGPGSYTETAAITVTNDNVKFIGALGGSGTALMHTKLAPFDGVLDGDLNPVDEGETGGFILEGNGIEIAHLGIQGAAGYWMIGCADDADPSNNWIHDCYFYAHSTGGPNGVQMGRRDGDYGNAVSMVVENNVFFKCGTAINLDGSRAMVRGNTFYITHTKKGILCPQSGSQRNSNEIVGNKFVAYGTAQEQVGINFSGANTPTAGTMFVDNNTFVNFASATLACDRLLSMGGTNKFNDTYITAENPPVAQAAWGAATHT